MKKLSIRKINVKRLTMPTLQAANGGPDRNNPYSHPNDQCTSEFLSNCGACPYPTNPLSNRGECW